MVSIRKRICAIGFAPIFPDTCYHLTHYWPAAVDIPVASDNPVHYADAIRYNARTPLQGSLLPLNTFGIDSRHTIKFGLSAKQRPYPTITIRGQLSDNMVYTEKHIRII